LKKKKERPISFIKVYSESDYDWLAANMLNCEIWKVDIWHPNEELDSNRSITVTVDDHPNDAFSKIRTGPVTYYQITMGTSDI